MRLLSIITTLSLLLPPTLPLTLVLDNATHSPLSLRMAYSITTRHEGIYTPTAGSSGPLQAGIIQKTFTQLLTQYPLHPLTPTLSAYTTQSADSVASMFANTSSALKYPLDRLSTGNAFLALAEATGEERYVRAVHALGGSVDLNRRNAEGGLWYYVYPEWSYLDGMFSFGPFSALYTATFDAGNHTAWADLKRQFNLLAAHCAVGGDDGDGREGLEGLLVHGYDDSRTAVWANNSLGQSPHVWGRSLGWYVLGLLETVGVLDEYAGRMDGAELVELREEFKREFQVRMDAVVRAVDPATGAWELLLDQPGREGNYIESSGSAMFTWALLKGVRKGYLPPARNGSMSPSVADANASSPASNASYIDVATRAYAYLRDTFVVDNGNGTLGWNGTVSVCSLNSTASYEYYTTRPILYNSVLGSAAFVGASAETERLC